MRGKERRNLHTGPAPGLPNGLSSDLALVSPRASPGPFSPPQLPLRASPPPTSESRHELQEGQGDVRAPHTGPELDVQLCLYVLR